MKPNIAVIGSGVIGLMSGIRLLESGFDVTIFSREHEPNMASRAAPALWVPYKVFPEEKVLPWAEYSLNIYKKLLENDLENIGVRPISFLEYQINTDLPLWTKLVTDFTILDKDLPEHCNIGFSGTTLLIDSSLFVDYLLAWFKQLNGKLEYAILTKIENINPQFKTIINCSGVWSHQLVPDNECFPIRGQYIIVEKVEDIEQITFVLRDEESYTLIVPRTDDCYIGGTVNHHDWNTNTSEDTTNTLLANAKKIIPQLANAAVKKIGVGLRPGRNEVRLEKTLLSDGRNVIHNYGHGGAGFTIGWGCAADVVKLVHTLSL